MSTHFRVFSLLIGLAFVAGAKLNAAALQDSSGPAKVKGFVIDKLYDVPSEHGSWVSITVDDKGRLIASDQYGGLYRITLASAAKPFAVEPIAVKTGRAHGLLYAFNSLYVMSHEGDGQPSGLYRVRDLDGDDKFDDVKLLRQINGSGEHGPHAIVLSPDKKSLYVCAGNHTQLTEIDDSRVPKNWQEDQIVPRMWDANGHAAGILAPGGWICKTDPEGKSFELISMGYRNEYDIAFDPNGELFTFDADMEWDIGLPWYRPTRICHAIPGSEFGWRSGTGKWPVYWPDSLPPVVDIGPGSPTGIVFGTGAKFPAKYQNALFASDWSYGAIYAIHFQPVGSSFVAEKEVFAAGPGMDITDLIVNPIDGALYYLIGGRKTQSALFRVTYKGPDSTAPAKFPALNDLAELRRALEDARGTDTASNEKVVTLALANLGHSDRFIRYSARVALEKVPLSFWSEKVLGDEDVTRLLEEAMAIARCGDGDLAASAGKKLLTVDWNKLTSAQKLHWLRDVALLWLRHFDSMKSQLDAIASYLKPHFPGQDTTINMEIARLLCGIDAAGVVAPALKLMTESGSQEEQIHYAFCLRVATKEWTIEQRRVYFQWFVDAGRFRGGNSFAKFLLNTRSEAVQRLSESEEKTLGELLAKAPVNTSPVAEVEKRPIVKNWKLEDLLPITDKELANRDLENGSKMFAVGQCYKCHRVAGSGGSVGPDLTPAGRRFNTHDLLETLIVPSKEVSDQYQATLFQLENGKSIVGRVANLNGDVFMVQTDMYDPGNFTNIRTRDIVEMKPSTVSMMPVGLLDSMNRDDVIDLLAYLRSVSETAFESK